MKILIGDLFSSNAQTLVNTVNCVGIMGKGIAEQFKKRYPDMYKDYQQRCKKDEVKPGIPYLFSDLLGTSLLQFPTKDHWRSSSRLAYIEKGLDWFVENYEDLGIRSIAFPPLGCGNGGLPWDLVGPLMYRKLKDLPIDIEIYAPYGTETSQVSETYLALHAIDPNKDVVGSQGIRRKKEWDIILYVIQGLNADRYSLSVGHVAFQKICYALTRSGVDTGFQFTRGDYGPFSMEAKRALTTLSNDNVLFEQQLGSMIEVRVGDKFQFSENDFDSHSLEVAARTIDLFSRIRNAEQAEMVATVLFGCDDIENVKASLISKKLESHSAANDFEYEIAPDDRLIEYILMWKPHWNNAEKILQLKDAFTALVELEWVKPCFV